MPLFPWGFLLLTFLFSSSSTQIVSGVDRTLLLFNFLTADDIICHLYVQLWHVMPSHLGPAHHQSLRDAMSTYLLAHRWATICSCWICACLHKDHTHQTTRFLLHLWDIPFLFELYTHILQQVPKIIMLCSPLVSYLRRE